MLNFDANTSLAFRRLLPHLITVHRPNFQRNNGDENHLAEFQVSNFPRLSTLDLRLQLDPR